MRLKEGHGDARPGSMNRIMQFLRAYSKANRERLLLGLAIAAIVSGLILGFVSLLPSIEPAGSTNRSGTLGSFSERNESFRVDLSLSDVRLENSSCSIFVTLLNDAQLAELQTTGTRPAPQLSCNQRIATFDYALRWIIIENRGSSSGNFAVSVESYRVRSPWALLAIPAMPLALAGIFFLAFRGLQRGIGQIRDEMDRMEKRQKKR